MTGRGPAGLLDRAAAYLAGSRPGEAAELAQQAVELEPGSLAGWRLLALAREAAGDLPGALLAAESALALAPGDADLLGGLGRIALEMGLAPAAEGLLRQALAARPGDPATISLLARALAAQSRGEAAIDLLMAHLDASPQDAVGWDALGVQLADRGDIATARTCFAEAMRLAPDFTPARFNAANLRITEGDARGALETLETMPEAGLAPRERATLVFARACARLRLGDLQGGWKDYAVRNDPDFPGAARFDIPGRRWRPGDEFTGLKLLVVGEQGLGDEVMFAGLLPDLLARADHPAALSLAVEPRLVSLFRRAFPGAEVGAHQTVSQSGHRTRRLTDAPELEGYAAWTPMADLLPVLRPEVAAFRGGAPFLVPDPERVRDWRGRLEGMGTGPRIGLLWKSGLMSGARGGAFAGFAAWAPVLQTAGVTFVNLQYGDCTEEIAYARDRLGVEIHAPADLDLKQDLEGVTALSCALDLVVGVSNASFNLAAAAGAPAWLVSAPDAWTTLGADDYPWYPQVRLFASRRSGDWDRVFGDVAQALAAAAG